MLKFLLGFYDPSGCIYLRPTDAATFVWCRSNAKLIEEIKALILYPRIGTKIPHSRMMRLHYLDQVRAEFHEKFAAEVTGTVGIGIELDP